MHNAPVPRGHGRILRTVCDSCNKVPGIFRVPFIVDQPSTTTTSSLTRNLKKEVLEAEWGSIHFLRFGQLDLSKKARIPRNEKMNKTKKKGTVNEK